MTQPHDLDRLLDQLSEDKARYDAAMLHAHYVTTKWRYAEERRFLARNPNILKAFECQNQT